MALCYSSTIGDASLCSDRPASTRVKSHNTTVLSPQWRTMWMIYLSLNPNIPYEMGEALLGSKSYTRLIHLASCSKETFSETLHETSLTRCAKLVRVLVMQACNLDQLLLAEGSCKMVSALLLKPRSTVNAGFRLPPVRASRTTVRGNKVHLILCRMN